MTHPDWSDQLDDWLAQMPSDPPPPDLTERICAAIRTRSARRRMAERVRWMLSAILALGGGWLALPRLADAVVNVKLPRSAVPWLLVSYETLRSDLAVLLDALSASLMTTQGSLNAALSGPVWLGLLALGLAAILAMDKLLPRKEV